MICETRYAAAISTLLIFIRRELGGRPEIDEILVGPGLASHRFRKAQQLVAVLPPTDPARAEIGRLHNWLRRSSR